LALKEDEILGNPALLIMDFAHLEGKQSSLIYLIDKVREKKVLKEVKSNLLFISSITPLLPELKKIGFYQIPQKVNPRVLNLLARTSSNLDEKPLLQEQNWLLTLGDWDVF
jgi:hypothetical protein